MTREPRDDADEITEADLAAAEREELYDEANLELFSWWVRFGGLQRGFSLDEISTTPTTTLKDFALLLGKYNRRARRNRRRNKDRK